MATLLALVAAKHSELTMLCIDIQYPFLQHHAAIFIPALGVRWIDHVILHLRFVLNLIFMLNLCPCLLLENFFMPYQVFRNKSDGSHVSALFWGDNRQHVSVCAK